MSQVENRAGSVASSLAALFRREQSALQDPYAIYKRLRNEAPVLRHESVVVVSRYDDIRAILRDPETFSSVRSRGSRVATRLAQLDADTGAKLEALIDHESLWVVENDPPDHSRLRGLANQAFTPRRIAAQRDRIQEAADSLLVQADRRGAIELVDDFAYRLPLLVVAQVLGVEAHRTEDIRIWSQAIHDAVGTDYSNVDEAYDALVNFREYVTLLIKERRSAGNRDAEDLFTSLVWAEEGGRTFSDDELVAMFMILLAAGHETTTNLLANSVIALTRDPAKARALIDDPTLFKPGVEELLRHNTAVHAVHRVATRETDIGGVLISEGQTIRLLLASANHDQDVFDEPEILDFTRDLVAARHLAFGFGIHTCLGAWLARLEIEVGLSTLFTRYPNLHITNEIVMRPNNLIYGPQALHLQLR